MARLAAALAICCFVPILGAVDLPPALASLVETERAFARMSLEKGQREAFLAFFADDGIVFNPHPVAYKQDAAKRPAPGTRPPSTLAWEPIFGDVSAAGDLGYTTGPYRFTDHGATPRPPSHGYFFSVWRKQPDGTWKVAVDLGTETPSQEPDALRPRFQPAPHVGSPAADEGAGSSREALLEHERRADAAAGGLDGRLLWLDTAARLHRNGSEPVLGRDTIRALLAAHPEPIRWTPLAGDAAASGDLGYTYGTYQVQAPGTAQPSEKGYYVHVWRRATDGEWRIVVDVTSPLPPEGPTR